MSPLYTMAELANNAPRHPSADYDGPDWLRKRLGRHVSEMLRLAPPIVLARSGIIVMVLVDTIIVGHYSALELGYLGIGMSLVQPIVVTSLGLIMGTLVLTANHFGGGRLHECGAVWRRSVNYALALGVGGAVICLFGAPLLSLTGQSAGLSREGGEVMRVLGYGLPGHLLFLATSFFLEGMRRTTPGMVFMVAANLINLGLTYALVHGIGDIPAMGAVGAAWGTSIARTFLGLGMAIHVLTMRGHEDFGVRNAPTGGWASWGHQRRLGYAMGTSLAVESFAFTTIQQFAGWLGPMPLASFTVAFYLLVISFMVAIGFGAATAVRVGIAHGRGDHRDVALAGWTGLGLTVIATAVMAIILVVFQDDLPRFFSDDAVVIVAAAPLLFWAAVALVSDGCQAVLANALRGRQDVWASCGIQAIAFLGVMTPLTWWLVFPMEHGAAGLFQGVMISTVVALVLLSWRFHRLYRRDVETGSD